MPARAQGTPPRAAVPEQGMARSLRGACALADADSLDATDRPRALRYVSVGARAAAAAARGRAAHAPSRRDGRHGRRVAGKNALQLRPRPGGTAICASSAHAHIIPVQHKYPAKHRRGRGCSSPLFGAECVSFDISDYNAFNGREYLENADCYLRKRRAYEILGNFTNLRRLAL